MSKVIHRHRLPIDGEWHTVEAGTVVFVAARPTNPYTETVEVWVEHDQAATAGDQSSLHLKVVGTGQPVEDEDVHVGSTLDGAFVWHVYRRATLTDQGQAIARGFTDSMQIFDEGRRGRRSR